MICDICLRNFQSNKGMRIHRKHHDEKWKEIRDLSQRNGCQTVEAKKNHKLAMKEFANRDDIREKKSKAQKEIWSQPGVRKIRSEISKKIQANPTVKEKQRISNKEAQNRPEVRFKKSEKLKISWIDPVVREKRIISLTESQNRPEVKMKKSFSMKKAIENDPSIRARQHETMKRNSSYGQKTQPECHVDIFLQKLFGIDDVEYQVFVHKWPIDFYVKSKKLYIQVDGDYWHGLDRSIEQLLNSSSARDKVILKKIQTDKEQNQWFAEHCLKLVRIRESDVRSKNFSIIEVEK